MIDLRSDTVTLPSSAMRRAMAEAEVGDDVYGEDPTINRLEARAAEVFGREAAIFVPSGSMGNAIAIKLHTRPGQEIICELIRSQICWLTVLPGAIYALIALGYTMVYGIIELINFAHGEICMVGAYIGFGIVTMLGVTGTLMGFPLIGAMLLVFACAMAGCAVLGVSIERVAYKPLRESPRLAPLITAVGMSIFLQNAMMHVAGADQKHMPSLLPQGRYTIAGATITWKQPFTILMALALMIALQYFINRTRLGTAMRAVAQIGRPRA